MLRSMSATQFQEWMMFFEMEPFGEERNDYRSAQIVQTLANLHRDPKTHPNPFNIDQCLLEFGDRTEPREKQPQSPEYVEALLTSWITGHNMAVLRAA